tara:strand:+ start:1826 stop:2221 length:396 start_codon:yes stop_codon:yes gene_type:complete
MTTTQQIVLTVLATKEAIHSKRLLIVERQDKLHNAIKGEILVGTKAYNTIELPWKENQINISCIPAGTYTFQKIKRTSNNQNALYIREVTNRTEILIHQGTKPEHSHGCILVPEYEELHRNVANKGLIIII